MITFLLTLPVVGYCSYNDSACTLFYYWFDSSGLPYSSQALSFCFFLPSKPASSEGVSCAEYQDFVQSTASCLQSDFDVKRFALRLDFKNFVWGTFFRGVYCFVHVLYHSLCLDDSPPVSVGLNELIVIHQTSLVLGL